MLDDIAALLSLTVVRDYVDKDYSVKKITAKKLFDQGLIKSSDGTFTLQDE